MIIGNEVERWDMADIARETPVESMVAFVLQINRNMAKRGCGIFLGYAGESLGGIALICR